jgi:hypothetical protein
LGLVIKQDTVHLATSVKRAHEGGRLTSARYKEIQEEYIGWINARVRSGISVEGMNQELRFAGILCNEPDNLGSSFSTEQHAGFPDEIRVKRLPQDEFLVLIAGIYTDIGCTVDETVLLYSKLPLRRIAMINGDDSLGDYPRYLSNLALAKDGAGIWLIASGWFTSWCTSTVTEAMMRIDAVNENSRIGILHKAVPARRSDTDWAILPEITGKTVAFRYATTLRDNLELVGHSILSYRINGVHASSAAPVALSRGVFLNEWLGMSEEEAARWSTPAALAQHRAADIQLRGFQWEYVCHRPDSLWEVGVLSYEANQRWVFVMNASRASSLRIISISHQRSQSCTQVETDLHRIMEALFSELPS